MKQLFIKLKSLPIFDWPGFLGFYFIQSLYKRVTDFQKERNEVLNFCIVHRLPVKSYADGQVVGYDNKQYILRSKSSDYAVFKEVIILQEYSPVIDFID